MKGAIDRYAVESVAMRRVVSNLLRDAVREFNESPISVNAVDTLRERVLRAADMLDPGTDIDWSAARDAMVLETVGLSLVEPDDRRGEA